MLQLRWLPELPDWRDRLRALVRTPGDIWPQAVALANARIDFTRTNALDGLVRQRYADGPPAGLGTQPVRLAILGSSTTVQLHAAIRVAGLRRNIWITTNEPAYGQYLQEMLDPGSGLHAFKPTALLFAFDARHATRGVHAGLTADAAASALNEVRDAMVGAWRTARNAFGCPVMQQACIDVFPALLGSNEHRLPGSRSAFIAALNTALREAADREGVDIVAVDHAVQRDGLAAWHDPALWHRAKQEITPAAGPTYGELVARILAARQGRAHKCLVLDLDNTLWGGVIGDDGLDGIVIGQGSALGEGFAELQHYARELARRGVILAVSSKNDEKTALEPFEKHPDMVLRRTDIAAFRADWTDKAANIRAIAQDLNIGLDSLVFLDDNPAERIQVRDALPMVAVPEVPDDPAMIPHILADAGYFESLAITAEDRQRAAQYQENIARAQHRASASDLSGFLRGLEMRMIWRRFDTLGLQRITQLINKTNQFNLTTCRYTEADIAAIMADPACVGLQIRLLDRFGDNGIIAVVIGRMTGGAVMTLDTWLMSCRVLGRGVEAATLNLVAATAAAMGATSLRGLYRPTARNGMVRDHYELLGFTITGRAPDGATTAVLELADFQPRPTFIDTAEG